MYLFGLLLGVFALQRVLAARRLMCARHFWWGAGFCIGCTLLLHPYRLARVLSLLTHGAG